MIEKRHDLVSIRLHHATFIAIKVVMKMAPRRVVSGMLFRRLWVAFCDHSIIGVWRTRKEAENATRLRVEGSLLEVEYHVVGPYILRGRQ